MISKEKIRFLVMFFFMGFLVFFVFLVVDVVLVDGVCVVVVAERVPSLNFLA